MGNIASKLRPIYWYIKFFWKRVIMNRYWGYMASDARFYPKMNTRISKNICMYEDTNVSPKCIFNISTFSSAKFIMKKHSGMASGVLVIVGNHAISSNIGSWRKSAIMQKMGDIEQDIILEEDVWVGANAIILSGVIAGRGSIVGAGAVVRNSIPPYSIVVGNPAKVIGFVYSPEEVIAHEKALYPENQRLPIDMLEKNYNKYFINRIKEIKIFTKL